MVYITSFNKINIVQTGRFPHNVACEIAVLCLEAQRLTLCLGVGHFPDLSAGGGLTDVPVLLPIVLHLSLQTWLKTHTHTHTHTHTYADLHMHTYFNFIFKITQSCTRATNTNTHPPTQATEKTHDCQPVSHIICQLYRP